MRVAVDARVFSLWDQAVVAGLVLVGAAYVIGSVRLRARGVAHPLLEQTAFAIGWTALVASVLPPVDAAAIVRFSAHMGQHEWMMLVGAPLLIAGRPFSTCLWAVPSGMRRIVTLPLQQHRVAGITRALTAPLVAWTIHGMVLWVWHVPALYELAVRNEAAHTVQHAMFVGTATLFWWGLLYGRYGRAGYGAAVIYVFTTALHTGLLGAAFTFAERPFYSVYAGGAGVEYGDALIDQQLAGLIMWIPAGLLLTAIALGLLAAWMGEAQRREDLV